MDCAVLWVKQKFQTSQIAVWLGIGVGKKVLCSRSAPRPLWNSVLTKVVKGLIWSNIHFGFLLYTQLYICGFLFECELYLLRVLWSNHRLYRLIFSFLVWWSKRLQFYVLVSVLCNRGWHYNDANIGHNRDFAISSLSVENSFEWLHSVSIRKPGWTIDGVGNPS